MMFERNTLIYIIIPVIHWNYDANDALKANIHVVIPVINRNYDINKLMASWEQISQNHENYIVIPVIHQNYDIIHWFISGFRWMTGITM